MADSERSGRRRVVVGVDGSPSSKKALAWAGKYAALVEAPLNVVAVWQYPTSYGGSAVAVEADFDLSDIAKTVLSRVIPEVLGTSPGIEIIQTVIDGYPTFVLLEESKDAELLVVGCRGLSALKGIFLGSVSMYLATHARCPVVIIHDHGAEAEHESVAASA